MHLRRCVQKKNKYKLHKCANTNHIHITFPTLHKTSTKKWYELTYTRTTHTHKLENALYGIFMYILNCKTIHNLRLYTNKCERCEWILQTNRKNDFDYAGFDLKFSGWFSFPLTHGGVFGLIYQCTTTCVYAKMDEGINIVCELEGLF